MGLKRRHRKDDSAPSPPESKAPQAAAESIPRRDDDSSPLLSAGFGAFAPSATPAHCDFPESRSWSAGEYDASPPDVELIRNEAENLCGGIDFSDLPRRELPAGVGGRTAAFQVVIRQSALNRLYRHGRSTTVHEVCGVMVGDVFKDAAGPFLYVDAVIEGDHASGGAAQVTFTAETWAHVQEVMEREYPERRIVGWYHTHPGFGIFLSDMDLFLHSNFFNLPWQVAFVYDPVNAEEGLFLWQYGRTARAEFLVEADEKSARPKVRKLNRRPPPPEERPPQETPGAAGAPAGQLVPEKFAPPGAAVSQAASEAPRAPSAPIDPAALLYPPQSANTTWRGWVAVIVGLLIAAAGLALAGGGAGPLSQWRDWLPDLHRPHRAPPPPMVTP